MMVTNWPEPDHGLLASLNRFFPECEVHIVFKKSEIVAEYPTSCSSDRLMAHAGDIEI